MFDDATATVWWHARPVPSWSDPVVNGAGASGSFVLPAGTVTCLLTDVERSSLGWQAEPNEMALAEARHYELLDVAISAPGGVRPLEQREGDSVVAAFVRVSDAVLAALDAQRALAVEPWTTTGPLRVRMAIHTGEARLRDEANTRARPSSGQHACER